ncbi:hypothetical protein [Streptomyces caeruleatus]|uniref:hypothetical protein n=1 Tax=Streptomyces caeruleatus TaxID=661399 RepID=UPI001FC95D75|nr:hypothetical protein [Streptomyces caeruleatus]
MSKKLLLAILWQEQQWWQNHDRDLKGPLPWGGGLFDWTLRETVKPDKSLGITHMKLETVRDTLDSHNMMFKTADGGFVSELSDSQLTKYIEQNPNEAIRLSAYHLKDLRDKDEYGAGTDKQLFTCTPPTHRAYGRRTRPMGTTPRTVAATSRPGVRTGTVSNRISTTRLRGTR